MLIFYRKSLEENIEKFVENIKKASKNLDKENQKFIEDIFLKEKNGLRYGYSIYLKDAIKQELSSKKGKSTINIIIIISIKREECIYPLCPLLWKKFLKQ